MKTSDSVRTHFMIGHAKLSEIVAGTFFTFVIFGFYLAHYVWNTGFFTASFTPLLAVLFYASILYAIVNNTFKVFFERKDLLAFVDFVGSILFMTVAAWCYAVFPFECSHVADVVPIPVQFLFTWLTNDAGRIIVTVVFVASIIALIAYGVKLVWRMLGRCTIQLRTAPDSELAF